MRHGSSAAAWRRRRNNRHLAGHADVLDGALCIVDCIDSWRRWERRRPPIAIHDGLRLRKGRLRFRTACSCCHGVHAPLRGCPANGEACRAVPDAGVSKHPAVSRDRSSRLAHGMCMNRSACAGPAGLAGRRMTTWVDSAGRHSSGRFSPFRMRR